MILLLTLISRTNMENARDYIRDTYELEDLKEIANHGCQSGVCSQHIYYGDTVEFYENFETDILDELTVEYETEFLVDLFRDAGADLTCYKNAVCWAYIEMVAFDAVREHEEEYAMSYA